jgi:recombination protein RecT
MSTSALKAAAKGELPPEQARNPYEHLKRQLEVSRGEFAKLVGGPANADKFIRVVLNAVLANTRLMDVSRSSLIAACMKAAQDGLMPDGRDAVLNIYATKVKVRGEPDRWEDKAQYLPMVGGLIKKMYASKEITYVDATVAHEGDVFKYQRGDTPSIYHEPKGGTDDKIIAAYAIVKLANGEVKREVMWRADIERVRAASKSADTGPWKTWFGEMAIKSVLKRINKQLPHSDAFDEIERYDNAAMGYNELGESVADIAQRTLHEHDEREQDKNGNPALEHQPGEVLEPTINTGEGVTQDMIAESERAAREHDTGVRGEPLPAGVTPPDEKSLSTAVEVKMRAAKTRDELDLAAEGGRTIKDKALRLRLDEIYEAEFERFKE